MRIDEWMAVVVAFARRRRRSKLESYSACSWIVVDSAGQNSLLASREPIAIRQMSMIAAGSWEAAQRECYTQVIISQSKAHCFAGRDTRAKDTAFTENGS